MKKRSAGTRSEKFYLKSIRNKTPRERLKMLDGMYEFAKKVNPNFFKWPKHSKTQRTY